MAGADTEQSKIRLNPRLIREFQNVDEEIDKRVDRAEESETASPQSVINL